MLKKEKMMQLFKSLNQELAKENIKGEVYLVGGAVMCLAFSARPSTQDIDAYFEPAGKIRQAIARVAIKQNVDENWLNDGVKGFLSSKGEFEPFFKLDHLRIFCATAEYLLAMKCLAMRIGEEFHDLEDVRYLLRNLNISNYDQAIKVISKYYPTGKFPQKSLYVLEELLSNSSFTL